MTKPSRDEVLKVAGEPVAWCCHGRGIFNNEMDARSAWKYHGMRTTELPQGLYTEAQLLAMYAKGHAAGAADMKERAAMVLDKVGGVEGLWVGRYANIIRALPITPTNTEGEQG